MTLSRPALRRIYDRVGRWQDTQSVYETPALDALVANAPFGTMHALFELGCGTGRLAARLLRNHLPSNARYVGVDLSATMTRHARHRLVPFSPRASVRHTDGRLRFPDPGNAFDGVLATYVLDLLPPNDIQTMLDEAHRLLRPDGRLCLAGLTHGQALVSRGASALWSAVHQIAPALVGGCRPLDSRPFLQADGRWHVEHHDIVTGAGIPSEVVVARARR